MTLPLRYRNGKQGSSGVKRAGTISGRPTSLSPMAPRRAGASRRAARRHPGDRPCGRTARGDRPPPASAHRTGAGVGVRSEPDDRVADPRRAGAQRLVSRDPETQHYGVGMRLARLGEAAVPACSSGSRGGATGPRRSGRRAGFARRADHLGFSYVEHVQPRQGGPPLARSIRALHATASGKVLLTRSAEERYALLRAGLPRFNADTIAATGGSTGARRRSAGRVRDHRRRARRADQRGVRAGADPQRGA